MTEYLDKVRSIATPRKAGTASRRVERHENATVITTEHWDGRQDATVRPDTVRYGARTHNIGSKKGTVAEVAPMSAKEKKRRYGD